MHISPCSPNNIQIHKSGGAVTAAAAVAQEILEIKILDGKYF
jgi:hypothetical protein